MIQQNIIIELFMYFARFPKRTGIYPMFNIGSSSIPGYDDLKTLVDQMPEHSLMDIQEYIFGANFDAIKARVNNIPTGKNYLFVDFGEIDCDVDSHNRNIDSAALAISVAYRVKGFATDIIEQTLVFSHALDHIINIRNTMIEEQQCHRWLKNISNNHRLLPFISSEMNSLGWTLMFDREGFDSFNVKKLNL